MTDFPVEQKSASRREHPLRGYLYIAAATLCWAISANMGKAVFNGTLLLAGHRVEALDAEVLSQMRVTFSALALIAGIFVFRGWSGLRMGRKEVLRCFALGIFGLAGSNFFYYFAIEKTTVTTAIVVQYTAPAWVLLYMIARRHERPTALRILAVLSAVFGSALAIGVFSRGIKLVWIGIGASLLAAFTFAFSNIFGRNLVKRLDHWRVITFALLGATLFWLAINSPAAIARQHYSDAQWSFMAIFAATSVLLPYGFYFAGLKHLDPTRAVVTSCLEPVFTILLAATFLGEAFGWLQGIGIVLVLAATIVVQLPARARNELAQKS